MSFTDEKHNLPDTKVIIFVLIILKMSTRKKFFDIQQITIVIVYLISLMIIIHNQDPSVYNTINWKAFIFKLVVYQITV